MEVRVSDRGTRMITGFEAVVTHVYKDQASIDTVCVGHVVRPEDHAWIDDGVTLEECDRVLHQDLASVEREISTLVTVPLTQDQVDALASWEFNCGGLRKSTLLVKLNQGDYDGAANEFVRWNKRWDKKLGKLVVDTGLTARREAEANLFRRGITASGDVPDPVWQDFVNRTLAKLFDLYDPMAYRQDEQEGA